MNKKLFQRINDIYTGAIGHEYKDGEEYLGAEELANVITALSAVYDPKSKHERWFTKWNIKEFDSPTKATAHIESLLRYMKDDGSIQD